MTKEFNAKAEVKVGLETLWRALSKDLAVIIPKVIPNVVKEVKVIKGDGGLGTIFLFTFSGECSFILSGRVRGNTGYASPVSYQKEKITVLDEFSHEIALDVVEGGHLNQGLTHYTTSFQLSAIGELQTLVNVKISFDYEPNIEESTHPMKTSDSALSFLKCLEKHMLNDA